MTAVPASPSRPGGRRNGWVVVGGLFLMLGIVITARNSIGLLMPFWRADLGWSYGFVSSAGAVMLVTMALAAPTAGMVIDRFGPRPVYCGGMSLAAAAFLLCATVMDAPWQLIVFYSILGGLGFSAIAPSLVSTTTAAFFDSRLALATSVATSGSTAGQIALMPGLALLVTTIAWRPSMALFAGVILVTMTAVLWLIGPGLRPPRRADGARVSSAAAVLRGLSRDRTFWLLTGGFAICGFTTAGVIKIHLIPYAVACGFPPVQSAAAYGVMSAFSLIGMIGYGYLADRFNRPLLLASIYFLRALTFIILMNIAGNTPLLFVFAVLFGLFDYATFPIVASIVASHIGRHIMGVTMGLIFSAHSLGGAAGSYLAGRLFELFARYDWVWIVSVGLALLAALFSILIRETRDAPGAPAPARAVSNPDGDAIAFRPSGIPGGRR